MHRQHRAIIYAAKLKITKKALVGTNPNTTHGSIVINIKKPNFGTVSSLELSDFNDAAGLEAAGSVAKTPVGAVYTGTLNSSSFSYMNKTGLTQLRLAFQLDDNNDNSADYLAFYSGNNTSYKPVLQVYYYIP